MITTYYSDKLRDMGGDIVYKKSLHLDTRAVITFANQNWVSTFSNWAGIAFGFISLLVMVVL